MGSRSGCRSRGRRLYGSKPKPRKCRLRRSGRGSCCVPKKSCRYDSRTGYCRKKSRSRSRSRPRSGCRSRGRRLYGSKPSPKRCHLRRSGRGSCCVPKNCRYSSRTGRCHKSRSRSRGGRRSRSRSSGFNRWVRASRRARRELGIEGFVKMNRGAEGREWYKLTRDYYDG